MQGDSREFSGCFKEVSRVFHDFRGCFQNVPRKFQENFLGVSKNVFYVAWHSSQLPEQKEGLFHNNSILASLWSIQLIGIHLFLKITDLWVYLVHEDPKNEHLSFIKNAKKNGLEWPRWPFLIY